MTIVGVTGHRPEKLGGYSPQVRRRLTDLAMAALDRHKPASVISGMALGWDIAIATAAIELNIPLIAAIPSKGQELRWKPDDQKLYRQLLETATEVHYVCEPGYAAWKMQKRNEWIVDRCNRLLALWDESPSGTGNCVEYARSKDVEVVNLWRSWVKYSGVRS